MFFASFQALYIIFASFQALYLGQNKLWIGDQIKMCLQLGREEAEWF